MMKVFQEIESLISAIGFVIRFKNCFDKKSEDEEIKTKVLYWFFISKEVLRFIVLPCRYFDKNFCFNDKMPYSFLKRLCSFHGNFISCQSIFLETTRKWRQKLQE